MEAGDHRAGSELGRRLAEVPRWVWFIAAALIFSLLPVILTLTVHNHGSGADPYCVRHCYTLEQSAGPGVLVFVGAPVVLIVGVWLALRINMARDSQLALRTAWWLAILSFLVCAAGFFTSVGIAMFPAGVLAVCAVATSSS